jgi:hypothetical protein
MLGNSRVMHTPALTFSKRDDVTHEQLYPQRNWTRLTLSNSLFMFAERTVNFSHDFVNYLGQRMKTLDE